VKLGTKIARWETREKISLNKARNQMPLEQEPAPRHLCVAVAFSKLAVTSMIYVEDLSSEAISQVWLSSSIGSTHCASKLGPGKDRIVSAFPA